MSVKFHEAFCLDSARRRFLFEDHFLGDSVRDLWAVSGVGTGVVVDAQDGGIVRLTSGATSGNSVRLHWNNIRSLLVSKKVTMECRAKLTQTNSQVANLNLYFDDNNRIRFEHNTAVDANWYIITRDAGVPTSQDSGETSDTDYHIFRIECFPTGEVHFYIDDVETNNSPITTNIGADYYQPRLYIETLENVAKSMDVDYVVIRQER